MGVKTNEEKISKFSEEQKYIGFIWNAPDKTVRLPDEKLKERVSQIANFLEPGQKFTYKDVESFIGRLNHTVQIVPNLQCYLQSLYRWKKGWFDRAAKRTLPTDAEEDLTEWLETLSAFEPRRLLPDYEVTSVDWVGDAASSYGIGVLVGPKWSLWKLKLGWDLDTSGSKVRGIAWAESVAIRMGLLMLEQIGPTQGKKFQVLTDNVVTQDAINKRRSKDMSVNTEWKHIQKVLTNLQCDLLVKRVASRDNRADGLSRGKVDGHSGQDHLPLTVPTDLTTFLEQVYM